MAYIRRDYLYKYEWGLNYREGFDSHGFGVHPTPRESFRFETNFLDLCDTWAVNLNVYTVNNIGGQGWSLNWIGTAGTTSNDPDSYHYTSEAFDLTQLRFSNDNRMDCNWSWRFERELLHRRRYVAVAAFTRRYFSIVLTAWYNANHQDHIHFDNSPGYQPIRSSWRSDACLIQAAANVLNGAGIPTDGEWGPRTEDAYKDLVHALGLAGTSPRQNTSHAKLLLGRIATHGFANVRAGELL